MVKKKTGLVGFKQSNKAPLGTYQIHFIRMVRQLGKAAYGAEIERQLNAIGVDSDRGQVSQAGRRMEERGFLSCKSARDPKRPAYPVVVYAVTPEGEAALETSLAVYDGHRLFDDATKKKRS